VRQQGASAAGAGLKVLRNAIAPLPTSTCLAALILTAGMQLCVHTTCSVCTSWALAQDSTSSDTFAATRHISVTCYFMCQ
jgi:hypothetical protein